MRNILGDYSHFMDGFGLVGLCTGVEIPEIKWKTESYAGGGLLGEREVKTILDKMKIVLKYDGYDPEMAAAVAQMPGVTQNHKVLASYIDPGNPEVPGKILATGASSGLKRDEFKAGGKMTSTMEVTDLIYYEEWFGGKEIIVVDLLNGVLRIKGVDVMTQRRRNTGRL